jgi:hypothetical protein
MSGGRSAARERFGRSGSGTRSPHPSTASTVRFWGHDAEIDCFANCSTLHILPREVYGTGLLPDSKFQGYLVPDAYWEIQ